MSEKPILYNLNLSPPVRTVKIVARLIELDIELRDIDVLHGEHLREPFININPEHTVPTLDDNNLIIWDSHAICTYLIDKYSDNDSLYPKDLNLRARCNQRLFFNNGVLFQRFRTVSRYIHGGGLSILDEHISAIHEAYAVLEVFLNTDLFLVGDDLTLADICVAVTIVPLNKLVPIDEDRYPNINAWLGRFREAIPFFDEMNEEDAEAYYEMISFKIKQNNEQAEKGEVEVTNEE